MAAAKRESSQAIGNEIEFISKLIKIKTEIVRLCLVGMYVFGISGDCECARSVKGRERWEGERVFLSSSPSGHTHGLTVG